MTPELVTEASYISPKSRFQIGMCNDLSLSPLNQEVCLVPAPAEPLIILSNFVGTLLLKNLPYRIGQVSHRNLNKTHPGLIRARQQEDCCCVLHSTNKHDQYGKSAWFQYLVRSPMQIRQRCTETFVLMGVSAGLMSAICWAMMPSSLVVGLYPT